MPLYEYECEECGERFETLVSAGRKDETKACPGCGSRETARVPSTFSVGSAKAASESCSTCCPGGTCGL